MKNFILKHKIKLLLILFFVFIFLSISTNVFATDVPQEVLDKAYQENNNNDNYVILQDKNTSKYYIAVFNDDSEKNSDEPWYYSAPNSLSVTTSACLISHGTKNIKLLKYDSKYYYLYSDTTVKGYLIDFTTDSRDLEIVYSKHDICYYGTTDVFFPIAPPEEEAPATLLEVLEQEKGATLQEIVALLPVILSVLVSLIALRKALRMLSNFLRKS